jgi:hypothetical protein
MLTFGIRKFFIELSMTSQVTFMLSKGFVIFLLLDFNYLYCIISVLLPSNEYKLKSILIYTKTPKLLLIVFPININMVNKLKTKYFN